MSGLMSYFSYPFVKNALIVGALIALCSSLLGVTLVLRRFSFIGDGLSHVAFGAMAVAAALGISSDMPLTLVITVISAVLMLRAGGGAGIKGDAALAMVSVGALAVGYLLMNVFSKSSNLSGDVCSALFGSTSILTLTKLEVWLSVLLSVFTIAAFLLLYNKLFSVTFDESFAKAVGVKTGLYNLILALLTAVTVVLSMKLVGSLLISALIIFPALSAMRVFKSFLSVTVCAAAVGVLCTVCGIVASIVLATPVGATVVAVDIIVFGVFYAVGKLR